MEILALFDDEGRRRGSVAEGINYKPNSKKRQSFIDKGYIPISEEDWALYCNQTGGNNGTGYIRDKKTGEPISAPAYVPTKEEKATLLFRECQQDLKEIDSQIVNAIIMKDTKLEKELRQERDERIAKYQKELDDLGGEE